MFLSMLKKSPNDKIVISMTVIGFLIVLSLYLLVFIPIEASLNDYGILDFEFSWTAFRAEEIMSAWGSTGINKQTIAIYWDFIFIIGYVSIAFGLNLIVSRKLNERLQSFGITITLLGTLSGLFDIIENVNLLVMLDKQSSVSSINPLCASFSATIKFGLLIIAIIFFLCALVILFINKLKKK